MAYSGTVSIAYHGTAGTVADTVNFSPKRQNFRIINGGANAIYVAINGTAVAAADDTYLVQVAAAGKDNALEFRLGHPVASLSVIGVGASIYSLHAYEV